MLTQTERRANWNIDMGTCQKFLFARLPLQ